MAKKQDTGFLDTKSFKEMRSWLDCKPILEHLNLYKKVIVEANGGQFKRDNYRLKTDFCRAFDSDWGKYRPIIKDIISFCYKRGTAPKLPDAKSLLDDLIDYIKMKYNSQPNQHQEFEQNDQQDQVLELNEQQGQGFGFYDQQDQVFELNEQQDQGNAFYDQQGQGFGFYDQQDQVFELNELQGQGDEFYYQQGQGFGFYDQQGQGFGFYDQQDQTFGLQL